ncbi:MAG: motility protein A [Elusimicrobiota bacterium]
MPNLTLWLGVIAAASVMGWSLFQPGAGHNIMDTHGLVVVLGGAAAAMLISTPAAQLFGALRAVMWVLSPGRLPTPEEIAAEISRLSRLSHAQGGLLALRNESMEFGGGFLHRSISAAAACGETDAARDILELEVRRKRIARQEDANVFRTLGTLAPMFGLMGTLLGMLKVLTNMTDPTKLGPAMALALSSAFIGIGMANVICVPLARTDPPAVHARRPGVRDDDRRRPRDRHEPAHLSDRAAHGRLSRRDSHARGGSGP